MELTERSGWKESQSFYSAPVVLVLCSPILCQRLMTHWWSAFLEDLDYDTQREHLQLSLWVLDMFVTES